MVFLEVSLLGSADRNLDCSGSFLPAADRTVRKQVRKVKKIFINVGAGAAVVMQAAGAGGYLLENAVALYAYAQTASTSVFAQYFFANATHELAMQVIGYSVCGVSLSTVATTLLSMIVGVIVIKVGIEIYNLCVEEDQKIYLNFARIIHKVFFSLFAWLK